MKIALVFSGKSVNPDVVTKELELQPDEARHKGDNFIHSNGAIGTSHLGIWKLANLLVDNREDDSDLLDQWCDYLASKSEAFVTLKSKGYYGRLEIQLEGDGEDDIFIHSENIKQLGYLGLSVSVDCSFPVDPYYVLPEDYENLPRLVITGPVYYARKDENSFFEWLKSIRAVRAISGSGRDVWIYLHDANIDDASLRDLIALMTRYQIDMSPLQSQCNDTNAHWFKDPKAHWYHKVFGSGLTYKAQAIVDCARAEANKLGQNINAFHILLGVLIEGSSVGSMALRQTQVTHSYILAKLADTTSAESESALSDQLQRFIDLAWEEAKMLKHNYVAPEHLMLAVTGDETGKASLLELGIEPASLRATVLRLLGEPYKHVGEPYRRGDIPGTS